MSDTDVQWSIRYRGALLCWHRYITIPNLYLIRSRTSAPIRPQSRGLEFVMAGLQSLRLASRLKLWLRTIDGLGWLMAAPRLTGTNYKINCCKLVHSVFSRPALMRLCGVLRLSVAVAVVSCNVMYCG